MKRADPLAARLLSVFAPPRGEPPRFQIVEGPNQVLVEEMEKAGRAEVVCRFPEGFRAIPWRLQTGDLRPIGSEKNADGALLLLRPDGALEAHVMECKQTVDSTAWRKALLQLEWTVIRLLAIAGALHERIERVVLYTAFRTDALSVDQSADPELFELGLGDDLDVGPRRDRDWMKEEIHLPGWATRFEHVRVQKDDQGRATLDLRVARVREGARSP